MKDDSTYRRWAHGHCVCCGGDLCEWIDETPCKGIGEGVLICGRCVAMEHDREPGLVEAMLLAIVLRDDSPVEAVINGASANLVTDNARLAAIGRLPF